MVQYSESLAALAVLPYSLGILVDFGWGLWLQAFGVPTAEDVRAARIEDVVRALIAMLRTEHFSNGHLAACLRDSTLLACVGRLLDRTDTP